MTTNGKKPGYGAINPKRREQHRASGGKATGGNHTKPVVVVDWDAALERFKKMMAELYGEKG